MKLSTRVRFGCRIMVQVAAEGEIRPVFSRRIAQQQDISEAYVDQILLPLRAGGLLISQRGRTGGYRLAKPADQITVLNIVEVLEGEINMVDCIRNPESCKRTITCPTRPVWSSLNTAIQDCLAAVTLEQLCADSKTLDKQFDYDI